MGVSDLVIDQFHFRVIYVHLIYLLTVILWISRNMTRDRRN